MEQLSSGKDFERKGLSDERVDRLGTVFLADLSVAACGLRRMFSKTVSAHCNSSRNTLLHVESERIKLTFKFKGSESLCFSSIQTSGKKI